MCSSISSSTDGERLRLFNPGNLDEVIGEVALAGPDTARAAMESSHRAFRGWPSEPLEKRFQILSKALELLEGESREVAHCITLENGKPIKEAQAEVKAALRDGRFQLSGSALHPPSNDQPFVLEGDVLGEIWHAPLGVFLVITPWNFPLATVIRKVVPALIWGNTVIIKSAQQTPLAVSLFFNCLKRAGLPDGVAHLILGKGSDIGDVLVDDPVLKGISFTGSTEVGTRICRRVAGRNVRLQMEMGGKNALVILNDADLKVSVRAAVTAAFTCSGQWCTSTSRIIVEDGVYEMFCRLLVESTTRLCMGPGLDPDVAFGPVASGSQKEIAVQAITQAKKDGARLLCGGDAPLFVNGKPGNYIEPTVFGDVTETMPLFNEEIFGPVIGITRAKDEKDALRLVNRSPYGLSFSVYTADSDKALRFLNGADCGMAHHNLHTGYRHPALPISGWKESGRGIPECGHYARDFYTQIKAVYRKN
ncbi:MAG: aldehyde dehydrogenase family protein [Balneolales bacterium]